MTITTSSLPQVLLLCADEARARAWRDQIATGGRHEVAAAARSAAELKTLLSQLDPDAIVCELRFDAGRAVDLTRALRRGTGSTGAMILVIAPSADHPELLECLRNGADSYYVDRGPGPSLDNRLHEMFKGEAKMSPEIARQVLDHFMRTGGAPRNGFQRPLDELLNPLLLSPQDRAILQRLAQGQSVPDIASAERITIHQVAKTIRTLYSKMTWDLRANGLELQLL